MNKILLFVIVTILFSQCTFEKLFYYPNKKLSNQNIADSLKFQLVEIKSKNENKIYGYLANPSDTTIGAILLLHGNAGNISDEINYIETLKEAGFVVFAIDYQGFGLSSGEVSHQNLVDDANSALKYLGTITNSRKLPIIVLGMSIGGHLAVKIASDNQQEIKALVIEGAFTNHHAIATAISPFFMQPFAFALVKSKYKASDLIKDFKIPKLIIHSSDDETIPFWMGVELYKKAEEPKEFWQIKGCHICGLHLYKDEYLKKLKELTK